MLSTATQNGAKKKMHPISDTYVGGSIRFTGEWSAFKLQKAYSHSNNYNIYT